ncbi:MAG: hypothetical protein D6776_06070 [Planctomycetota bacterium]|nr:MAG: hypothetical protein D6776_06070 [Planctomycetota bacterium]
MDPGELQQVRQVIERSTSKVSLRELERKGFRKVKVLRSNDINELIRKAVHAAIGRANLDAQQHEQLVRESQQELRRLMKQAQKAATERAELLETNRALEAELERTRAALREAEAQIEQLPRLRAQLDEANVQRMALESRTASAEAKLGELTTLRTELEQVRAELKRVETEKRLLEELEVVKLRERIAQLEGELREARAAAPAAAAAGATGIDPATLRSLLKEVVSEVGAGRSDDGLRSEFSKLQQTLAAALANAGGRSGSQVTEADLEAAKVSIAKLFEHDADAELESNIAKVQVKESTSSGVKSTLNKLKSLRKGGSAE